MEGSNLAYPPKDENRLWKKFTENQLSLLSVFRKMNGVCHVIDEVFDADIEEMWKWLSNFTSMSYFGIPDDKLNIKGEGVGCIRSFEWKGQPVEHRLLAKVDETHLIVYDALMAAKPFDNTFMTTIHLEKAGEKKTRLRWYASMIFGNKELMDKALVGLQTHHLGAVKKWIEDTQK